MRYFKNPRTAKKGITLYLIIAVIIVALAFWEVAASITFLVIGGLAGLMYLKNGIFDRVGITREGLSIYTFSKKKTYPWHDINDIGYKNQLIPKGEEYKITVRINGAADIIILDNGSVINELKKYYNSESNSTSI